MPNHAQNPECEDQDMSYGRSLLRLARPGHGPQLKHAVS